MFFLQIHFFIAYNLRSILFQDYIIKVLNLWNPQISSTIWLNFQVDLKSIYTSVAW